MSCPDRNLNQDTTLFRTHLYPSQLPTPRSVSSASFYRPTTPSLCRTPSSGSTLESHGGRSQTPSRPSPSSSSSGIPMARPTSRTGLRTESAGVQRLSASSSDVNDETLKADTPSTNGQLSKFYPQNKKKLMSKFLKIFFIFLLKRL